MSSSLESHYLETKAKDTTPGLKSKERGRMKRNDYIKLMSDPPYTWAPNSTRQMNGDRDPGCEGQRREEEACEPNSTSKSCSRSKESQLSLID